MNDNNVNPRQPSNAVPDEKEGNDESQWPPGGAAAGLAGAEAAAPTPSLGRIVRYVDERDGELPAIVVAVHSPTCVDLRVFARNDGSLPYVTSVEHASVPAHNQSHWYWPPRV